MKAKLLVLLSALVCLPLHGEPEAAGTALAKDKADRKQVVDSMIGIRSTLLFYTWSGQKAALRLSIDNKNTKFPVKGTVYLFDPATTKEGLAKWLNNQHSDGLFADAAKPTLTTPLPDGTCRVTAHKLVNDKRKEHNGFFSEYDVTISVKAFKMKDKVSLEAFEDTAKVFVKQLDG